jgi:hypothetical protein
LARHIEDKEAAHMPWQLDTLKRPRDEGLLRNPHGQITYLLICEELPPV